MGNLKKSLDLCFEEDPYNPKKRNQVYNLLHQANHVDQEDFSSIIDYVVKYFKISQDLIDEFGVSDGTISRWRNNHSKPPTGSLPMMVQRIAGYIKLD